MTMGMIPTMVHARLIGYVACEAAMRQHATTATPQLPHFVR
jgi:hypothetical protein